MTGVFVTGTDTGVGKTVACAWLARHWGADYWKPIQSGTVEGRDADTVARLAGLAPERIHPSAVELAAPLSPDAAARLEGRRIDLADFHLPATPRPLVVEGAGGVLVPLNERDMMAHLIIRLGLPVVVVARTGLGTINHSLLTLEALRCRTVEIAGIVLVGPPQPATRDAILAFGGVRLLGEIAPLAPLDAAAVAALPAPPPLETL